MNIFSFIINKVFGVFVFTLNSRGSVEEGKVAIFLAATTGMLNLRYSIMKKKMLLEVGIILCHLFLSIPVLVIIMAYMLIIYIIFIFLGDDTLIGFCARNLPCGLNF